MQNAFKQFGARGTGWFKNLFQLSLWRLTILYTFILAIILFISSSFIYGAFSRRLEHRFRASRLPMTNIIVVTPPPPTADEVRSDLVRSIIIVNGLLLTAAAILSYFLAKLTIRPLEEMDEKQKKFFGDASHELRTPLSILKIELENQLDSNTVTTEEKNRLTSQLEEINRMTKLVNNLLTLSRFDEHVYQQEKNFIPLNLIALIKKAADHLQPLATHQEIDLLLSLPTEDILINSNPDIVDQILTNLIKNAIAYNKPNGTVTVAAATDAKAVKITVSDTGIGMNKDEVKKVFDRFYRTDTSRSSQAGGSGLGLSIVKSSLQYLGGEAKIDSAPGNGTTITIHLPLV